MFRVELLRLFCNKKIYIMLLIAIICEVIVSLPSEADVPDGFNSDIYRYYIGSLEGEFSEKKYEWIANEYNRLKELIENEKEYEDQYKNDEISGEEYRQIVKDIKSAYTRIDTVAYIVDKSDRFLESKGSPEYFYDIAINDYILNMSMDFILIIILIILIVPVYTEEYSCNTVFMVRSSGYGRKRLFGVRCAVTVVISAIVGIVFPIVEFVTRCIIYDMGNLSAEISSISSLQQIDLEMSIRIYILITFLVRCFYTIVSGLVIMMISTIVHNNIAIMSTACMVIIIPYFMDKFINADWKIFLIHNGLGVYKLITNILT